MFWANDDEQKNKQQASAIAAAVIRLEQQSSWRVLRKKECMERSEVNFGIAPYGKEHAGSWYRQRGA
jgi:hypothetical protein